jgi:hypothetical protein
VGWRSGARQIVDPIDFKLEGINHIMADHLKVRVSDKVLNVRPASGEKIVETDDLMSLADQALTEVGTKESGAAGDKDTHKNVENVKKLQLGSTRVTLCREMVTPQGAEGKFIFPNGITSSPKPPSGILSLPQKHPRILPL